jgi:hypothetical protein
MKLEIVWRNPVPPPQPKNDLGSILEDEKGSLYIMRGGTREIAFELIRGGLAS